MIKNSSPINGILKVLTLYVSLVSLFSALQIQAESEKPFAERLNYSIHVPENAHKIDKFAAQELRYFLEKLYQKKILLNGTNEPIRFFVGIGLASTLAGFTDIPEYGNNFGVSIRGRNIFCYGYDDNVDPLDTIGSTGTLLSVYYFLQKYAGVNFFFPGEKGFAFNTNSPLTITKKDLIAKPSFPARSFYLETNEFTDKELKLFYKRMLCNKPLFMKAKSYRFERWGAQYFKMHPEYFAKVDGKRVFHYYYNCNPCFSNEDVVRRFAGEIIEIFNRNPDVLSVRFLTDNRYGPCQCEKCSTSKVRQIFNQEGHYSEEYFAFVQRVADIVFKVYPDRHFICHTKRNHYDLPPKTVKLDKRVIIDFLTSRSDPYAYPNILQQELKKIEMWNRNGNPVFTKSYNRCSQFFNYPLMTQHHIATFARMFEGHIMGMTRSDLRKGTPFAFCALNNYIQGKILFNIQENVDKLMAQFVAHCYPGAEKEMIAFYNEMETLWAGKTGFTTNPLFDIYTAEKLSKSANLLRQATENLKGVSFLLPKLSHAFNDFYRKSKSVNSQANEAKRKKETPIIVKKIEAIKIDGTIGHDEWKDVSPINLQPAPTVDFKGKDEFQLSSAFLAHDDEFLYVGLQAKEKHMSDLKLSCCNKIKGCIWADDSFEIMFFPQNKSQYYQIGINANGLYKVIHHLGKGIQQEDLNIISQIKSTKGKNGYTIELCMPLKKLTKNKIRKNWKFNIFRTRVASKDGKDKTRRQASGALLMGRSYHDVSNYLTLKWK